MKKTKSDWPTCKYCKERIFNGQSSGTNADPYYDYHLKCEFEAHDLDYSNEGTEKL